MSAVIAIVSLQLDCKMKIASGDIFLKVRWGNCGERWRWRYHYMVSAWFIFLEHIINVKILQTLKYQQKIETTNVMPAWKCDFRSSDCHETRPNWEREEGNTVAQNVKRPEASLNCWPWHDRTLLTFEEPETRPDDGHGSSTFYTFYFLQPGQAGDVKCNRPSLNYRALNVWRQKLWLCVSPVWACELRGIQGAPGPGGHRGPGSGEGES